MMTLRAREQDIRRERASSNVCTNQTLMAVTAAVHLSWLGPQGLREVALGCARATRYTREALCSIDGVKLIPRPRCCGSSPSAPRSRPRRSSSALWKTATSPVCRSGTGFEGTAYDGGLLVAATERRTRSEIDGYAAAFEKAVR